MFSFMQSMTPAIRAHMDAQLSMFSDMSQQLFGTMQKVNALNIQIARTMMEDSLKGAQQVLSAQNPQEAFSIAASQAQPTAERLRAYQQQISSIAASTQVDLARSAETHVPQTSRTAAALAEEVARRASEETAKATQRQRDAMAGMMNPSGTDAGSSAAGAAKVH
ncbi:phasin family protein [Noviherbaspirillum sp.]|uniref:phasin family protein n=1 Tax=Noviherbaspirillum sp. TaxID=1926288 RepID=UPI002FE3948A